MFNVARISRRQLLGAGLIGTLPFGACTTLPALTDAIGLSIFKDNADIERIQQAFSGLTEMSNAEIQAIRDRPVFSSPGLSRNVGIARQTFAALALGDDATISAAVPLAEDQNVPVLFRFLVVQLQAMSLALQGREADSAPLLLRAEQLIRADARTPNQVESAIANLLPLVAAAVDAGLLSVANEMLGRLPRDLNASPLSAQAKYSYLCTRLHIEANIAFRLGRYTEGTETARRAVATATDLGRPLLSTDKRSTVYKTIASARHNLGLISLFQGRMSVAATELQHLQTLSRDASLPVIRWLEVDLELILANVQGNYASAMAASERLPELLVERNWLYARRRRRVRHAVLQTSAQQYKPARATLNGIGDIDQIGPNVLAVYAAVLDSYLALRLAEPIAPAANRLRALERRATLGHVPEVPFLYWGARTIASNAIAKANASGADSTWSIDAARSSSAMRAVLRKIRLSSVVAEQAWPSHPIRAARLAGLEASAEAAQMGRVSIDDLLQAVAHAQESEVDEAVTATILRGAPPAGLTAEDMRRLQDAQLASRNALLLREYEAAVDDHNGKAAMATADEGQSSAVRLEKLLDEFEIRSPGFQRWLQGGAPTLSSIRASMSASDLLIAMVPMAKRTFVMAITAVGPPRIQLQNVGQSPLVEIVQRLRRSLTVGRDGVIPRFDEDAARDLYNVLFKGMEDLIQNSKTLLVAASDVLAAVPMACLLRPRSPQDKRPSKTQPWLIRSHAIIQLASVSRWTVGQRAGASTSLRTLLSWADPDFGTDGINGISRDLEVIPPETTEPAVAAPPPPPLWSNVRWPRLEATQDEARNLAMTMNLTPDSAIIMRKVATRESVLEASRNGRMAKANVLHFATHGLAPDEVQDIRQPALVMAKVDGSVEKQLLTLDDILGLKTSASIVWLSACNSASAARPGGDAMGGLARGFLYAGAHTVVATHWPVEDASTAYLVVQTMKRMLSRKQTAAQALREAMLDLIDGRTPKNENWARPFYWAPFTMIGTGPTV